MEVHHPTSLPDALRAVAAGATPLAGGTDLMVEINFGHALPDHVVGLRRVEELNSWEDSRIGGWGTWRAIGEKAPTGLA